MIEQMRTQPLANLLDRILDHRGRTPKKLGGDFVADGVPVLSAKVIKDGVIDSSAELRFVAEEMWHRWMPEKLQRGDVLLTSEAPLGEVAYLNDSIRYCLGQRLFALRADEQELHGRYLYYFLKSTAGQHRLSVRATGSTVVGIRQSELLQVSVDLPSIEDQRAIAGVLGALDDKIEQNRRTARALERLARAIFRAWFVDFEPVQAKAAGATSFPSMTQAAFDALPTRLVDSAIGPVPEGWEVKALGDICEINARSVRKGEIDGEIEYVDIASVSVGQLDEVQRLHFADAPSRARRRVQHGDTIWSCVRPNRRSYLFIHSPPSERIVSTGFAVLSPTEVRPAFLYQTVTQSEFVDYLVSNADGSAYPAVRADHFDAAEVLVPMGPLVNAFDELAMPMRDWIAQADSESRTLAELRDLLLPKLLSGAVRVGGAQTIAEGAKT